MPPPADVAGGPSGQTTSTRVTVSGAPVGLMGEFLPRDGQSWEMYAERLQFFLEANNIVDEARKRAVFIAMVGGETYAILRSLISPASPGDKSLSQLLETLRGYFAPRPSEIVM